MERDGFEPSKSVTTDLQSAPFGHSGISPHGAGDRNRTNNLLITNQLLCQLSYTSRCGALGRNRTTDTGIFSPLLYRLSYQGINMAIRMGLEPMTSSVTGWRSNQLNYRTAKIAILIWWAFTDSNRGPIGYEPTALTN